jgi:hypothetical protein
MTPKRQGAERWIASTPFSFDGDCEIRAGAALLSETQKQQPRLVVTLGQFHQSKVVAFRNDPTLDARITGG